MAKTGRGREMVGVCWPARAKGLLERLVWMDGLGRPGRMLVGVNTLAVTVSADCLFMGGGWPGRVLSSLLLTSAEDEGAARPSTLSRGNFARICLHRTDINGYFF
jgi:hypothetical protein